MSIASLYSTLGGKRGRIEVSGRIWHTAFQVSMVGMKSRDGSLVPPSIFEIEVESNHR